MLKCAIIGTGSMGNAHAEALKKIPDCQVVAGVDVDLDRAKEFCKKHNIPSAYSSVEELLQNEAFDAASVVTPDAYHKCCVIPLLNAQKHVLCEKPLAPNAHDAKIMWETAKKAGVINMVNFSYRNSSALQEAKKVVAMGKLGRIRHFEAHYLQPWLSSKIFGDWKTTPGLLWRLSTVHGSKGSLGDLGVHIIDMATFACNEKISKVTGHLKCFDKAPSNMLGEYHLDANDSSFMTVELSGGAMGVITTTRWAVGQTNSLALRIYGEKGGLRLDLDSAYDEYEICSDDDIHQSKWKKVKVNDTPNMYERFIESIKSGINDPSDFERGYEIQKILDATFESDAHQKTILVS